MKTNIGEIKCKSDFFECSVVKSKDGWGHPVDKKNCSDYCIGEHRTLICKYCGEKFESGCIGAGGWGMEDYGGREEHLKYHQGLIKTGYLTQKVEKGLDFWKCKRCGDELKRIGEIQNHDEIHKIADEMELTLL